MHWFSWFLHKMPTQIHILIFMQLHVIRNSNKVLVYNAVLILNNREHLKSTQYLGLDIWIAEGGPCWGGVGGRCLKLRSSGFPAIWDQGSMLLCLISFNFTEYCVEVFEFSVWSLVWECLLSSQNVIFCIKRFL